MCKVICDTNIWYDLASGKITAEQIEDFKLIATNVNVTEISTTPNLKNNLDLVKGAILEIKNKHYQIFPLNPIEHIAAIFNIAFPIQKADFQRLLDNFATFVELDFENDITQEDTLKAIEQIKKNENDKIVYANLINQNLYAKKMEIRKNHEKKTHVKKDFKIFWRKYISNLIEIYFNKYYRKAIKLDLEDENWIKIEFFMTTIEYYFKKLEIDTKRKYDKNDLPDLFNLVYVQPGYKYLTSENKWNNLTKENRQIDNYLIRITPHNNV